MQKETTYARGWEERASMLGSGKHKYAGSLYRCRKKTVGMDSIGAAPASTILQEGKECCGLELADHRLICSEFSIFTDDSSLSWSFESSDSNSRAASAKVHRLAVTNLFMQA